MRCCYRPRMLSPALSGCGRTLSPLCSSVKRAACRRGRGAPRPGTAGGLNQLRVARLPPRRLLGGSGGSTRCLNHGDGTRTQSASQAATVAGDTVAAPHLLEKLRPELPAVACRGRRDRQVFVVLTVSLSVSILCRKEQQKGMQENLKHSYAPSSLPCLFAWTVCDDR